MKKMSNFKKLLIVVVILTFSVETYAQVFGLKAGFNLSSMCFKNNVQSFGDNFKLNPGFNVGASAEFPINNLFSFETSFLLSTKGYTRTEQFTDDYGFHFDTKEIVNLYYFNIPLTMKATYGSGKAKIYGTL